MKKFITLAVVVGTFGTAANFSISEEHSTSRPPQVSNAQTITVVKDGKKTDYNGEEWVVVRRRPKKPKPSPAPQPTPSQTPVACPSSAPSSLPKDQKTIARMHDKIEELSMHQQKKNRIRALGGYGITGYSREILARSVRVQTDSNFIGGVGYDRMLNRKISVGGQVFTNGTLTLGVGLDF